MPSFPHNQNSFRVQEIHNEPPKEVLWEGGNPDVPSFNTLDSGSSPGSTKPVPGLTRYPGSARNDYAFSLRALLLIGNSFSLREKVRMRGY